MFEHLTVFYLFLIYQAGSAGDIDNNGLAYECWTSNSNDIGACNDNGYCWFDDAKSICSCFHGFSGTSCEFNVRATTCSEMDCGFSGIQGECITDVSEKATCACYTGWIGASCSTNVEYVEYCNGVSCNNQGRCVVDTSSETMYSCECYAGWGGTDCGEELPECSHNILLDMFTRLISISGDLHSSLECGFAKPAIYSSLTPAMSDPFMFAPCICVSIIEKFADRDYHNLEDTCRMDNYRHLPFIEQVKSYCPACSELQDDIMEDVITTKSAACWHFIYQRTTMALYWRSMWKCSCVLDVGVQSTTETIINCPFTQHNSVDDYISYENCVTKKICDWESIYTYFEVEYSKKNLEGSVACKDWMEEWIFTIPGEQRFEDMGDSFCPCLDYLKGTGFEDYSVLNCIPITFHQLTMVEIYDQICYDPKIANVECFNYVSYASIRLGSWNYTAASLCWGAVELASGLDVLTRNLQTLICDCVVATKDDGYSYEQPTLYALQCLYTRYENFHISSCPNYVDGEATNMIVSQPVSSTFDSVSSNSESVWKTAAIVEFSASAILATTAFFLQRRKSNLNA